MERPCFHRFAYLDYPQEDREQRPHQLLDGDAFGALAAFLALRGYKYGTLLPNFANNRVEIDTSFFGPDDLIVLPTRPPLHDEEQGGRKIRRGSGTSLERALFDVLKGFFHICARCHIKLQLEIAMKLSPAYADRADICFRMHGGAWYVQCKRYDSPRWHVPEAGKKLTAAYFLLTGPIWPGGPRLLTSFSIGGTETLIWNFILCNSALSRLFDRPTFAMVELSMAPLPEKPVNLEFAKSWEARIILEVPLTESPPRVQDCA